MPFPQRPLLWSVLRQFGGFVFRIFYRRVTVHIEAPVPETGPLILAANHPNTLFDPVSVAQVTPRPIHFLAKSGLFKRAMLGGLLRGMGVIPVYRRRDDPSRMARNLQTFAECYRILGERQAVAIFPEGTSHDAPELKPLKTGAARIALEAEQAHGFSLGVRIVPVGLTYSDPQTFRSTVSVRVGAPLDVSPYVERYRVSPEETVRELTADLEERIRQLVVHMDRLELADRVRQIERVYREDLRASVPAASDTLVASRGIVDAAQRFSERDPERMERLFARIADYLDDLARWRLRDEAIREKRRGWTGWLAWNLLYGTFAFPLAAYGLANHYVPYVLAGRLARWTAKEAVDLAACKLYFGSLLFLVFYAAQGYAVARGLGWAWAIPYLVSLPAVGLWSLEFFRKVRAFAGRLRLGRLALLRPGTVAALRTERAGIKADLDALRDRYLEEVR